MSDCHFIHDQIQTLYNVKPMPRDQLPKVCVCGAPLTYADVLVFVTVGEPQSIEGVLEVGPPMLMVEPK